MLKIPENKTRKKLRITQCVLFLMLAVFCSFTFIEIPNPDLSGQNFYATVFDMLGYMGGSFPDTALSESFKSVLPFYFVFIIIPIVGFFFCAPDKERNLKNIVSIILCLAGVFSILTVVSLNFISYGSLFSLLVYILLSFITTIAMMARLTKDAEAKA